MPKSNFSKHNFLAGENRVLLATAWLAIACYWAALLWLSGSAYPAVPPWLSVSAVANGLAFPYRSVLDGSGSETKDAAAPLVVAVMIDNHPDARPQFGVASARVVYEAPVEGGLTRWLALYADSDTPARVGPIRSARPYFIDWAAEYGALYLHSGGSPQALEQLRQGGGVADVNEFWLGNFFWRDPSLAPPHNLFTNSERWRSFILTRSAPLPRFQAPWQFAYGPAVAPGAAVSVPTVVVSSYALQSFTIPFGPGNAVEWRYNASTSLFERYQNGAAVTDPTGNAPVAATSVIVQYTDIKTIDEEGRKEIRTTGAGPTTLFSQGLKISGTWRKEATLSRTRFYSDNSEEIVFAPGSIWVEVVPVGTVLEISN